MNTPNITVIDRPSDRATARHLRQGTQTALRMFAEIRDRYPMASQVEDAATVALARVLDGPAPQDFKSAYWSTMSELVDRIR